MSVNETQISQEPVDIYDKLHVESGHYNQNIISLDHFDFQVHVFTIHDGEYYTPVIQLSQKGKIISNQTNLIDAKIEKQYINIAMCKVEDDNIFVALTYQIQNYSYLHGVFLYNITEDLKGIQIVQEQQRSDIYQSWIKPSCSYAKNTQTLLLTYIVTIINTSLPNYASSVVMKGKIQFSQKFDNFYPQMFNPLYESDFLIVNNDIVSLDDENYAISSIIFPPQNKYEYFFQSDAQGGSVNPEDLYKVELYFAIYDQYNLVTKEIQISPSQQFQFASKLAVDKVKEYFILAWWEPLKTHISVYDKNGQQICNNKYQEAIYYPQIQIWNQTLFIFAQTIKGRISLQTFTYENSECQFDDKSLTQNYEFIGSNKTLFYPKLSLRQGQQVQLNLQYFAKFKLQTLIYDIGQCSEYCQTCLNDDTCYTCISSRTQLPLCKQCSLSNPPRIEDENCRCPDTYYDNGKDNQCQVCNKQCLTCESHALNCTSCPKENYKPESQCTKCIDGYYNYDGYINNCLLKCPSECKTCYNYEQCLSCKENYIYNPYTMKCQICENHYIWNQFSKQCQKCLYYKQECVLKCPLNTKLNEKTFVCSEINYEIKSNVQSYYIYGGIYCLYLVILYFIIGRKVVKIFRQRFNERGQGRQNQQQYQQVQSQNIGNNNNISNDINQQQNERITTEQSGPNMQNQNSLSNLNTESPLKKSKRKGSQRFRKISQQNFLQSQNLDIIQETQREDRPKEQGQSIIIDEQEEEEQKQQKNQKLSQNQQDQYLINNKLSDDIQLHTQQSEQQQQQLINTSMILNQNEENRQVDEQFEGKTDLENKIQSKNTSQILNSSNQQIGNSQQNSQNILYQNSNLVASMVKDRKKKRNQQQVFSQTLSQFQIKDNQQMQTSQLIENNNNLLSQNLEYKNNNKNISINIKDQSTFKVSDFQDLIN